MLFYNVYNFLTFIGIAGTANYRNEKTSSNQQPKNQVELSRESLCRRNYMNENTQKSNTPPAAKISLDTEICRSKIKTNEESHSAKSPTKSILKRKDDPKMDQKHKKVVRFENDGNPTRIYEIESCLDFESRLELETATREALKAFQKVIDFNPFAREEKTEKLNLPKYPYGSKFQNIINEKGQLPETYFLDLTNKPKEISTFKPRWNVPNQNKQKETQSQPSNPTKKNESENSSSTICSEVSSHSESQNGQIEKNNQNKFKAYNQIVSEFATLNSTSPNILTQIRAKREQSRHNTQQDDRIPSMLKTSLILPLTSKSDIPSYESKPESKNLDAVLSKNIGIIVKSDAPNHRQISFCPFYIPKRDVIKQQNLVNPKFDPENQVPGEYGHGLPVKLLSYTNLAEEHKKSPIKSATLPKDKQHDEYNDSIKLSVNESNISRNNSQPNGCSSAVSIDEKSASINKPQKPTLSRLQGHVPEQSTESLLTGRNVIQSADSDKSDSEPCTDVTSEAAAMKFCLSDQEPHPAPSPPPNDTEYLDAYEIYEYKDENGRIKSARRPFRMRKACVSSHNAPSPPDNAEYLDAYEIYEYKDENGTIKSARRPFRMRKACVSSHNAPSPSDNTEYLRAYEINEYKDENGMLTSARRPFRVRKMCVLSHNAPSHSNDQCSKRDLNVHQAQIFLSPVRRESENYILRRYCKKPSTTESTRFRVETFQRLVQIGNQIVKYLTIKRTMYKTTKYFYYIGSQQKVTTVTTIEIEYETKTSSTLMPSRPNTSTHRRPGPFYPVYRFRTHRQSYFER